MKNLILFIGLCLLTSHITRAQEGDIKKAAEMTESVKDDTVKHWHTGGLIGISFTQASFTNWAAGGQNSYGLTALASLHASYKDSNFSWLNDAELGYGMQKLDGYPLQKTTDQLEVTSSVGYKIFDHTSLTFLTNFQTQFQPGYTNSGDSVLISTFMAPAYWILAAGLQYIRPSKGIAIFASPITARMIFVENQMLANEGAFGVNPGEKELTQIGAYIKANYTHDIMKNVSLSVNLELFSDYLKDPQDIVVNWTNFLQLKVNKYISATINTQLIYDNNVLIPIYRVVNGENTLVGKGPRTQFKDVAGVGLAVNL
jgi:hypothetical protein